jgi:urease accessory protein
VREGKDELLWTAASIRGFVLVKFGAREVEGVKRWLLSMLREEGTVERVCGERATLCLRS